MKILQRLLPEVSGRLTIILPEIDVLPDWLAEYPEHGVHIAGDLQSSEQVAADGQVVETSAIDGPGDVASADGRDRGRLTVDVQVYVQIT